MLTPVNEEIEVNPCNVSYWTACYKYIIFLTFIHTFFLCCSLFPLLFFENVIYELFIWNCNIYQMYWYLPVDSTLPLYYYKRYFRKSESERMQF